MLFEMLPSDVIAWPTMPSSLPGFQSHILNPTNKHSLVSLLPVPQVNMIDDFHAYCPLEEITAFLMLFPLTNGVSKPPMRIHHLSQSQIMKTFLANATMDDPQD